MKITVVYQRKGNESVGDASDAVRALLEKEKEKILAATEQPLTFARAPEWHESGQTLTAILPYKVA